MEPDEPGTPDEPVTEIEVTTAIERFLEAVERLETRQNELRADVDRLDQIVRMIGKALRVLLEVAREHTGALEALELLNVDLPDLPEPRKPN
jgi:hypothetical protein